MDNFQLENPGTCSAMQAYKNTKLCNVLSTYRLAEKLRGQKVTVNAVDPGNSNNYIFTAVNKKQSNSFLKMTWAYWAVLVSISITISPSDTSLYCRIPDMVLMYHVVCPFVSQLLLVIGVLTHGSEPLQCIR